MNLQLSLLSLFTAWLLVLTIPGPNFMATTQFAISASRKAGIMIALGVSTGAATWATVSLLGISQIFEHLLWLYNAIRIVGGCYLIYTGANIILNSFKSVDQQEIMHKIQKTTNSHSPFKVGLFTSYSNPKTAVFFGSLFVMSFPPDAPFWFYIVTIGMVFCVSVIWYSLVAYFFSVSGVQQIYTRFRKAVDKATGSVFVILGVRLILAKS